MKVALAIIAAAALVRLALAAVVPLVPDEAYYWEWSRHLASGYFDHPPAIAWLVRAGTVVVGDTPLGVRLPSIVVGWLGALATVVLAHRLGGAQAARRAAIFASAVPLAGIGLVLATPDVPLLTGTAAALWAIDRAIETGVGGWVVAGVALGAALLSKYPAVLVPAAVAIACAIAPPLRQQFARVGPYLACAIAIVLFLPVVLWNARHEWISFAFQLRHGLGPLRGSVLSREGELLGIQLALVTPILFPLMVVATGAAARRPGAPRPFVLAIVAAFVWCFFAVSAMRHPVSPNWPALALLPATILLAVQSPGPAQSRWEWVGVGLGVGLIAVAMSHAVHPWLPIQPRRDPIGQAHGWDDLARAVQIEDQRVSPTSGHVWVAADRYQEASELAWALPGHPAVFSLELASRPSEFDFWPTASDSVQLGDALTLVLEESIDEPAPVRRLAPSFTQVVRGSLVDMHWGPARIVARRRVWHFLGLRRPLRETLRATP